MRVSAVVLTFASIMSLGAAQSAIVKDDRINMSCDFAQDKTGMLQYPYCCRDLQPLRSNSKSNQAEDCDLLQKPQLCEDQSRPACCYTIGPKKICTSHVVFQSAEDV
ncbi:hypothetical protein N7448_007528 [Penicillium atrosanguineum]|uniref:Uncharacterized protein n=1 Tax=Penicillium atrosanguineum TaxID=1132637 RepID=A0A9W9GPV1_9EURO|nr:uncharacterized protein N7443_001448 [Penicillium atrosanguineum]KAJ5126749.1 hypothetical protein N7448_007528 [Penicillium atrosanguineum]KAJ5146953.1 hypothetical protein N7526_000305 [Penicillium atrosanguineum]KAJ5314564.1 hypothetical protein N7443_001448 [Penicillium atrosanguineum]KAJ5331735.1 hypothetical protein N7476_001518 [Penicillium atrosanguineum]